MCNYTLYVKNKSQLNKIATIFNNRRREIYIMSSFPTIVFLAYVTYGAI